MRGKDTHSSALYRIIALLRPTAAGIRMLVWLLIVSHWCDTTVYPPPGVTQGSFSITDKCSEFSSIQHFCCKTAS